MDKPDLESSFHGEKTVTTSQRGTGIQTMRVATLQTLIGELCLTLFLSSRGHEPPRDI